MSHEAHVRLAWVVLALIAVGVLGLAWLLADGAFDLLAWIGGVW